MDRLAKIILSAEKTNINKHIEEHNVVNCKPFSARISQKACERNSARAFLTKKRMRELGKRGYVQVNHHELYACFDCPRYKKPSANALADVAMVDKLHFGGKGWKNRGRKERDMAGAPPMEGSIARIYYYLNQISSPDRTESAAIESNPGEPIKSAQPVDILDVGIPVEIDEDEMYK